MLRVEPVQDAPGWRAFMQVPRRVYAGDGNYVSEDPEDLQGVLTPGDQGASPRAERQAFVAYDGDAPVGRIVAIADRQYIEYQRDRAAFFGFYEAVKRIEVARALLETVTEWAKQRSLVRILGPVNPSMADGAGMLASGFCKPPLIGMPYNPDHYPEQLAACGLRKIKDFHSYLCEDAYEALSRRRRLVERWRRLSAVTFRAFDFARFEQEAETARGIYNAAFADFWGFSPVGREEFLALGQRYLPVLDEDLAVFALQAGKPVGFLMGIPDVNCALIKGLRHDNPIARQLTTLWHWKGPGRRTTMRSARVDMLAMHPDCREPGAAGLLILEVTRRAALKGLMRIEAAPVPEESVWWRSFRDVFGREPARVYRVFGREFEAGDGGGGNAT